MPPLQVEWDDAKAEANEAKHGIAFRSAARLLLDPDSLDFDTTRQGDREIRRKVIGIIEGRLFAVVYMRRAAAYRLISARRANRKEERNWLDLR